MSYKTYSMELAGRTLSIDIGRVAKQANGAALMHYGDTTVLCTATASDKPREGIDFFPLSVEFEEKMYSVGKIPGGFIKREGRPSEKATLTSRLIDRPLRPLFNKGMRNDVQVVATVLSVEQDVPPDIPAMIAYPTYSVAAIVMVTLVGVIFFKEKLSRRQILSMFMIFAALVLLNI